MDEETDETPLPEGLSEDERVLLRRYLQFYRSLETGRRVPTTEAQRAHPMRRATSVTRRS